MRKINKERAMQIYRLMIEYQHAEGFSMTTRDIAKELNLASNSDVSAYVRWLVKEGYAKTRGKQVRAIPYEDRGDIL